jgi:hypothetical protein
MPWSLPAAATCSRSESSTVAAACTAHGAEALVGLAVRGPYDEGREGGGARLHVETQRCAEQADAAVGAHAPALGGAAAGRCEAHAAALPKLLCACEGACEGGCVRGGVCVRGGDLAVQHELRGGVDDGAVGAHREELAEA